MTVSGRHLSTIGKPVPKTRDRPFATVQDSDSESPDKAHRIELEARSNIPAAARQKLEFDYDYQGRWIRKSVYALNPSTFSYDLSAQTRFDHDGWNLPAELDANNNPMRSCVWGLHLCGTPQGADGAGGLLASKPNGGPAHFAARDGNGNVTALVDGATGSISGHAIEFEHEIGLEESPRLIRNPLYRTRGVC